MPTDTVERLTPTDFASALSILGATTQTAAAAMLGVSQSRISEWQSGSRPIPLYISRLVFALLDAHELRARVRLREQEEANA